MFSSFKGKEERELKWCEDRSDGERQRMMRWRWVSKWYSLFGRLLFSLDFHRLYVSVSLHLICVAFKFKRNPGFCIFLVNLNPLSHFLFISLSHLLVICIHLDESKMARNLQIEREREREGIKTKANHHRNERSGGENDVIPRANQKI